MSHQNATESGPADGSREQALSALFAHMVLQQSNFAMMLLGKVPHPETGQTIRDLEGAKLFIDQLEMLEAKTKNNLSKEEERLLKQSLASLRMAFVESVEPPAPAESPGQPVAAESASKSEEPAAAATEESHKKFTKKY